MDGMQQKVHLIWVLEAGARDHFVNIFLRLMAAGSVREEGRQQSTVPSV